MLKKLRMSLVLASLASSAFGATYQSREIDQEIQDYISSEDVAVTISTLIKNVKPRSHGLCAKYVRLGFMASGLIPTHPGIPYARDYRPYFYKNNWTDLLFEGHEVGDWKTKVEDDLYQTPLGCAVVYDGIKPDMDKNGYIGHIETRVIRGTYNGFMSDYYGQYPRTGLKCKKYGKEIERVRTFKARPSSPYHEGGSIVTLYIKVKTCDEYEDKGSLVGDAWTNRYVTGVHCKL